MTKANAIIRAEEINGYLPEMFLAVPVCQDGDWFILIREMVEEPAQHSAG